MEKRRRARINESLGQLKTLILDALKKDVSAHFSPRVFLDLFHAPSSDTEKARDPNDGLHPVSPELQALQTGEGGHPGDDGEAPPEPPEGSDDR